MWNRYTANWRCMTAVYKLSLFHNEKNIVDFQRDRRENSGQRAGGDSQRWPYNKTVKQYSSRVMETRKSSRLVIVNEIGELLLFLYKDEHNDPFWATAGGELKSEETYLDAARRELFEETGLKLEIGTMLRERDEIYPVARSAPARWLEKYFLVKCQSSSKVFAAAWTEEEKSTIQKWKWWSVEEMQEVGSSLFKPAWLSELLSTVQEGELNA